MAQSDTFHLVLSVDDHPLPSLALSLKSRHIRHSFILIVHFDGLARLATFQVEIAAHLHLFLLKSSSLYFNAVTQANRRQTEYLAFRLAVGKVN